MLQSTLQGKKILLNSSVSPHTSYDVISGIGIVGADSIGSRSGIIITLLVVQKLAKQQSLVFSLENVMNELGLILHAELQKA
jgi:hypothetical protein